MTQIFRRIARLSLEKRELLQRRIAEETTCGFDLVAKSLRSCGITHLYGVAGLPTETILPACVAAGIRPLGVYHQSSAVCMAVAQNYQAARQVASALISAGPATTNAMTGLLVAKENGWPVVVVGGCRSSFQKLNVLPMVEYVTKHALRVPSTAEIPNCIQEAYDIAASGRCGPVYVELHEDVLSGSAAATLIQTCKSAFPDEAMQTATDAEIEKIAIAIAIAKRPGLLIGKGARWTVVPQQLKDLIETTGMPFITSPMGRGIVPDDHPSCFNDARTVLQSQADVVIVLGARLNWVFRHGTELSRNAKVFHVDVDRNDHDDAAISTELIHADAGDFVTRLTSRLKQNSDLHSDLRRRQMNDWHNNLNETLQETRRLRSRLTESDQQPMSPYRMMKEIRDALPRDAICITEGNISMLSAQPVIPAFYPAARMDAGTNACMGVGIPFAIGAKVAHPNRCVVAVVGDYGFSLAATEIEVCVRHNIPIAVVVANNQGNNGAIKQRSYFPNKDAERITMFQPGIEYDRIMKMFGGEGITVTVPTELRPAIEQAISSGKPYCINVMIDPNAPLPNAWGEQPGTGGTAK